MAVSQARIIESLERACSNLNPEEFIYDFLDAYGFPKSTITRLRNPGDSRNVADGNDIALKKKLYFRVIPDGQDVIAEAEKLRGSDVVSRNDIKFVIVTDFNQLAAFDLEVSDRLEIEFSELDSNYTFFLPLAGYRKAVLFSEHPADLKASEKMGQLFDLIRERNDLTKAEDIHALNVFLTRLLFCFYAEDTGIFGKGQMSYAIQSYTLDDGSDLDQFFYDLFAVLNIPENGSERQKLPAYLQAFKYVNGGLFSVDEPVPEFGRKARRILLDCALLDWSVINPDIFGSMFQAVIEEDQRSNLGQHYTSVSNIMKVIQPLFLDSLYTDLEKSRKSETRLKGLLLRLQRLRIFDPTMGSANFLIIAYKALRRLEMEVIDALNAISAQIVMYYSGIRLAQFYGIEVDDFACEIGTLSLWLAEHQMNMEFKAQFGYSEAALPLREGGNIVCGNSLRLNWEDVCPPADERGEPYEVYVCGNPPFLGNAGRSDEQNADMESVFSGFKSFGMLDLVASWFWKGAQYIDGRNARLAFVATNSICQGDQVATLWQPILQKGLKIHFAHQTFAWRNSARQNAAVHVVVVGLANEKDAKAKALYRTEKDNIVHRVEVKNISPYLLDAGDVCVSGRSKPLCDVSPMTKGSQPTDGGHLLLSTEEKNQLIAAEPDSAKWIRRLLGAQEFLQSKDRWCLWLVDATAADIDSMPLVRKRVDATQEMRLASKKAATRKIAASPHLFGEIRHPTEGHYILVPRVSSERRRYVPIGFLSADVISTDQNQLIPNGTLYEFAILTSEMHNDWLRTVAGRMKSDFRYSATLVYNNFPWPQASEAKRKHVESLAEQVLLIREDYPDKSLADLYDPDKMPAPLLAAHRVLDRAVEALYRYRPFIREDYPDKMPDPLLATERELDRALEALYRDSPFRDASERLEHMFARYEKLIAK